MYTIGVCLGLLLKWRVLHLIRLMQPSVHSFLHGRHNGLGAVAVLCASFSYTHAYVQEEKAQRTATTSSSWPHLFELPLFFCVTTTDTLGA